jgi:hypothetical protein
MARVAASKGFDKLSAGVRERARASGRDDRMVGVVVQLDGEPGRGLGELLKRADVKLKGDFKTLKGLAVEVPV